MPHSYETIDLAALRLQNQQQQQEQIACDELYNLTKLANVSIVYFNFQSAPVIVDPSKTFENEDTVEIGLPGQSAKNTTKNKGRHQCPDCGRCYSSASNLSRHRQTHRSLAHPKARKCPHCHKVYVSVPAFSMHMQTHSQSHLCHYCGKCFSRKWCLQVHIRTHTGEKPYACEKCFKAFSDKSNLQAHVHTHSTEKPYVCQKCYKTFAFKSYFYRHYEFTCGK